jgi:hypothetical protein
MRCPKLAVLAPILVAIACGDANPSAAPGAPPPSPGTAVPEQLPTSPDPGAPAGSSGGTLAGAPGTPPPAAPDPAPPPIGGTGSGRFQIGAAQGLYVVDPASGEAAVQGWVVVTLGSIRTGSFIPPDDTVVTLNGVALLRDPALNGAYWRVDPAGPQPVVGAGGRIVLTATGTVAGTLVSRTLVLPCPVDVEVASSPAPGAALTPAPPPAKPLRLTSASDLTLNAAIPALAGVYPTAMLWGYDPATRSLAPSGSPQLIPPGPLDLALAVAGTTAPAYLLDLRWPGVWVIDGETGGFCGLAKRFAYGK